MNISNRMERWLKEHGISFGQSKFFFLLFFILFGLGIFLTFPRQIPIYGGEFHSVFAVKGILESAVPEMPSGVIYLRNFISIYIQALTSWIFGFSEISMRLPIFLMFLPLFFLFFDYTSKTYNKKVAFIALIFLITSGWFLRYNQHARFYSTALYLLFFSFYFFDSYLNKKGSRTSLILFVVISAIGILNSKLGWGVFLLVLAPIINLIIRRNHERTKKVLFSFLILLLALFIAFLIPHRLYVDSQFAASASAPVGIFFALLQGLLDFSNFYGGQYGEYLLSWFGPLAWVSLASVPLILIFNKKNRLEKLLPILFGLAILIVLNIGQLNREPARLISVIIPYFYLSLSISIFYLYKFVSSALNNKERALVFLIFLALPLAINNNLYFWDYQEVLSSRTAFLDGPLNSSYTPHQITNSQEQANYISKNFEKGDKIISTKAYGWDNYHLNSKLDRVVVTKPLTRADLMLIRKTNSGEYRLLYHNTKAITSFEELIEYIKSNKRVWLLVDDRAEVFNNQMFFDYLDRSNNKKTLLNNWQLPVYLFNQEEK